LNAICWAIYGKIPKDTNIDDVIKEGEKSCEVEVLFSDETSIKRSRKPNELAMLRDGKSIKGKDAKETQTIIDDFVALSFETFCQTVYFAQNYTKKFITSNQEEKGKILSEVQDLVIFDKAGKEARSLIKLEEDALIKLKHTLELTAKDRELTKRDISAEELKIQHAYEQQVQRVSQIKTRIDETVQIMNETEASRAQLQKAVQEIKFDDSEESAIAEANNALSIDAGAISSEIASIDQLMAKRSSAEAQGKRYAARYKQILTEKEKNQEFIKNPNKNCPTCGAQLEACDTSHAVAELARLDEELVGITETLSILSAEIDTPIPTKEELNAKLSLIRQQRAINDARVRELRAERERIMKAQAHLNYFETNMKTHEQTLQKLKTSLEMEVRPLIVDTAKIDMLKAKLENLESEALSLTSVVAEKNTHLSKLEQLKLGFKEIKSYVFNSMLNEINARVQSYLSHLFEVPVSVRFRNEDMKIETDVKFDGVDRGLGLLSGGQFRRVSLAVDLALSDVVTARKGARLGILIIDEYFKDLSESSMEKCLTLLERRGQPVLLIEHNSIFKNIINNSIFVKLENGTSYVEV
jgi:DNA repair exonuclease SbcCD ATPase subunit